MKKKKCGSWTGDGDDGFCNFFQDVEMQRKTVKRKQKTVQGK